MHMNKLWRIFYDPRRVFDEFREDPQFSLPLVTILAAIAISTLVIAILSPPPTSEEIDEYRNQILLLADEPNRELAQERRDELYEELHGEPRDLPLGVRLDATFWDVPLSILGCLMLLAFVGSSFWVATKIVKSEILWKQWFGFATWINLPFVLIAILDVVFAALDRDRPYISLEFGEIDIWTTYWTIGVVWTLIIAIEGLRSWTAKSPWACVGLTGLAVGIQLVAVLLVLGVFFLAVQMFN